MRIKFSGHIDTRSTPLGVDIISDYIKVVGASFDALLPQVGSVTTWEMVAEVLLSRGVEIDLDFSDEQNDVYDAE